MIKLLFLILAISASTQVAFAHPYINSTSINDSNGPIPGIIIIGLENEPYSPDVEIEFLSDQWIVKNFVWMLLGSIAVFMTVFILIDNRKEVNIVNLLKKNKNQNV